MPKLPGREPTRRTYPVERLVVATFIMPHEEWLWRRICVVTDCDHRMGPDTTQPGWTDWQSCDPNQIPAHACLDEDAGFTNVGLVCPHHVAVILSL